MSHDNFPSSNPSSNQPPEVAGTMPSAPAPAAPLDDQFLNHTAGPENTPNDVDEAESGPGEVAKDLAEEGQRSAAEVLDTAKQEAAMVAEEAKEHATHLLDELSADLREQTSLQQRKVAGNLRDISNEFRSMLDQSQASGTAATLVDQASAHSGQFAEWLEQREPGDVVEEVKRFARKRPGAFLGIALGAGLLAGRISRNASSSKHDKDTAAAAPETEQAAVQHRSEVPVASSQPTSPRVAMPSETVEIDPLRSYPGQDPRTEDYR